MASESCAASWGDRRRHPGSHLISGQSAGMGRREGSGKAGRECWRGPGPVGTGDREAPEGPSGLSNEYDVATGLLSYGGREIWKFKNDTEYRKVLINQHTHF